MIISDNKFKVIRASTGKTIHRARWIVADSKTIIENGYIETENGTITAIGNGKPNGDIIDYGPGLLIPPLVNTHVHLELSALKGSLPFNQGFRLWVKVLLEKRAQFSEQELIDASQHSIHDLLDYGNLYIGEISTLGITKGPIEKSGLKGIWFQEFLGLQRVEAQCISNNSLSSSFAGHAPHSTSPILIKKIKKISNGKGLPFSIHLAESEDESEFIDKGKGQWADFLASRNIDWSSWSIGSKSPVEYISELGILDPATIAVHALNVSDSDLEILAQSQVRICICPRSNQNLHARQPKIERMLEKGIQLCLGTDSLASCDSLNIFDEMKFIKKKYPNIDPATVFSMATINGAKALGCENETGTIAPGKRAEFLYLPCLVTHKKDLFDQIICNG